MRLTASSTRAGPLARRRSVSLPEPYDFFAVPGFVLGPMLATWYFFMNHHRTDKEKKTKKKETADVKMQSDKYNYRKRWTGKEEGEKYTYRIRPGGVPRAA